MNVLNVWQARSTPMQMHSFPEFGSMHAECLQIVEPLKIYNLMMRIQTNERSRHILHQKTELDIACHGMNYFVLVGDAMYGQELSSENNVQRA